MAECCSQSDFTNVSGRTRIYIEEGESYWDIFLWDKSEALQNYYFHRNGIDSGPISGLTCPAPYIDGRGMRDKLGEIHFVSDQWDEEVVAHECLHATIQCMSILKFVPDSEIEDEERICYIHGKLVRKVYRWLWKHFVTTGKKEKKMGQHVKLPIPIEAVQFEDTLESVEAIHNMGLEPAVAAGNSGPELVLFTEMGTLRLPVGWWLLKERGGNFSCAPGCIRREIRFPTQNSPVERTQQ